MIRSLIKIGLLLVAGLLIYNYFFGTTEEKAQSKEVFRKTGDAVGAAWNLLKTEKQKFDAGKYDKVLDQLGGAYRTVREQAKYLDENVLSRLDELEQRKSSLQQQLDSIEEQDRRAGQTGSDSSSLEQREKVQRELDDLLRDTKSLLNDAQQE